MAKDEYDWSKLPTLDLTKGGCFAAQVESGIVKSFSCQQELKSVCKVPPNMYMTLRGLCKHTVLDTYYKPMMALGNITWIGLRGTIIWYNSTDNRYNIR